ncbi:MAG: type III pantothenate kinase [Bryobacteraceae bacterium]
MLLALDVGNSNITIGIFDGEPLIRQWRLSTIPHQTEDEWGILFRNLFALGEVDQSQVDGVVIASVVPPLDPTLAAMSMRYFRREPMFVTPDTASGLTVLYDNPREVGADRVVNGAAAFHQYGGPCIVVDLGTAITFDCVSANAEYLGGIICPGIGISIEALYARTAKLPKVDFRAPEKLIGTTTVGSIQSGLYYGAVGMIDGILDRLLETMGPGAKVIATGGQAKMIIQGSRHCRTVDDDLTLKGLRLIWTRNRTGR